MEQDGNEIVPRGEIPSEAEFARLLCDKTFVDYFNVFLSLPVFSQRLLFKFSDQSFELDPPLKRNQYRVDRIKLMRWVRTKRAPFFFKSDLYLEYLLCKQLQKSQLHLVFNYGADSTSAKEKMMDHCLMTRWLRRASGMRRFRCFISKTVGENSLQFWLDTERFRRASNQGEEKWAIFYRKMETKYFKSRNIKLPQAAQISPLQLYQSSLSSSTDTETTDASTLQKMTRDTCLAIQGFILKSLQNYWVPRYLIHCKQYFTKFSQTTDFKVYQPNCYAVRVRSLSEITDEEETKGDGKGRMPSDVRSHHGVRKLQLLKQSVGNLMSMFSSNQVRRSEFSTLLKVEDTGKMVRGGSAEQAEVEGEEMRSKGHDWLTEEFPLPAISEESTIYERSRSTSPRRRTPIIAESMAFSSTSCDGQSESDHDDKQEFLRPFSGRISRLSKHSLRRSSACRSASPRRSVMATDDDVPASHFDFQSSASQGSEKKSSSSVSGRRSSRGSARRGSSRSGSLDQGPSKKDDEKERTTDEEMVSSSSSDESDKSHQESPKKPSGANLDKAFTLTISTEGPDTDESDVPDATSKTHAESEEGTSGKDEPEEGTSGKDEPEEGISDKDEPERGTSGKDEPEEGTSDRDEPKPEKDKKKHHAKIADLNKYRRNSDSSRSSSRNSSSTSVGHSSVSSGSLISLSKRRMSVLASGVLLRPPGMPKHPGARRPRSQSVEFRLGDFARFINRDEEPKGSEKNKESKSNSLKDIKLEADIIALQALKKEREKKKKERLKQLAALKRKRARQKQEASSDSEVPDFGTSQHGSDVFVTTLEKLARRRKRHGTPISIINKAALKKLQQLHSITLGEKDGRKKLSDGKTGIIDSQKGMPMRYSLLPFEDKLREDDRKLMLICHFPEALLNQVMDEEVDMMESLVPRRKELLPAIKPQLPCTPNITKQLFFGYNLGEADFRSKNKLVVSAVLSDKFAGWPWMKFLVRYNYYKELRYLRFWHTAQEYLDAGQQISGMRQDLIRQRLAGKLISDFLQSAGDHKMQIGRLLTVELKHQLVVNSGDELLLHAQDLACEALRGVWAAFQKHDVDTFLSRTSERKNAQQRAYPLYTSPTLNILTNRRTKTTPPDAPRKDAPKIVPQVLTDVRKTSSKERVDGAPPGATSPATTTRTQESGDMTNSVAPYRMTRAVKLCSPSPIAGVTDAEVSDPSDPDEESDDEGSLRRKNILVLRKRKIKSPLPRDRFRPGHEETREKTRAQSRAKKNIHGYESLHGADRDGEIGKTGICTAIRKGGKTIHRPSKPRSFVEVLHDTSHIEFFRRFLLEIGNELPLSFWQSVEQLRTGNIRDPKVRQAKSQAIVKKYFNKSTNFGADLGADAEIITDIPNMEKVTPQMLMSAQTCVAKSMEEKWYDEYKESYADESTDVDSEAPDEKAQFGQKGRTKYLWNKFATNVSQFRRGLMTPWLLSLFKDYLGREVQKETETQKATGMVTKKIIGGRVVIVDKLQNDLCFWAEVERFKQLADNAARAAAAGTYTIEDEEYVQKKANAIIDVFLDSFVPPRVQINVPQEIAEDIIDISQHGIVERGLFHDAAVHTFTVLLYCWKTFTKRRLSYQSTPGTVEETTITAPQPKPPEHLAPGEFGPPRVAPPPKKKTKKKTKVSTPTVCGVKIKTIVGDSSDDAPRMFFTIQNGVQLILPPKPSKVQQDQESKDRYRNLMQTLISSGHEESLLQLFQQPAALGLAPAQQRRLSRTLALQLPAFLKQQSAQ